MTLMKHQFHALLLAVLVLLLSDVVQAGIQPFDLILEPTDAFVHYNDGYIRAPGFIDLGDLTFTAISESYESIFDEIFNGNLDDTFLDDDTSDFGNETTATTPPRRDRNLDGGIETDATAVDIAVFKLPKKCAHSKAGCDWPTLGIGKRSDKDGGLRWCCTQDAADLGICPDDEDSKGRLMVDKDIFKGNHRFVTVPKEGPMSKQIRYGKMEETESGTYVVLYANCSPIGREILVTGESAWKSKHGYLPGELFGFMLFFTAVTVVYFGLLVWYGLSMYFYEEHRIEIEKWIFFAIVLGLLEMVFRTGDYFVWNTDGYRSSFIIWIGVLVGVMKQGISRCLVVMVSMGWGVVRDSLGRTMTMIVVLGAIYIVASSVNDMMVVFAIEDVSKLSTDEEKELVSVIRVLTVIILAINFLFIVWILDALNNTVSYLENMGQTRKLERYHKLRCLFLVAVLFAAMWTVFALVDSVDEEGIVQEEHAWAIDAAKEVNYLIVLVGVAILWRPNPNAKQYAYVMELPAMGADGEENELELTGGIPSAADDDEGVEDFPSGRNGFRDGPGDNGHDSRFQIT